jgi:hypothetical protein
LKTEGTCPGPARGQIYLEIALRVWKLERRQGARSEALGKLHTSEIQAASVKNYRQ